MTKFTRMKKLPKRRKPRSPPALGFAPVLSLAIDPPARVRSVGYRLVMWLLAR